MAMGGVLQHLLISIHALREEGDHIFHAGGQAGKISIHALREEGDGSSRRMPAASFDFYPRPPRGGRHAVQGVGLYLIQFLSTPSARRATWRLFGSQHKHPISIHALREEGDGENDNGPWAQKQISIHALREEGDRLRVMSSRGTWLFLSTPSARRATFQRMSRTRTDIKFLSTPSARRATQPPRIRGGRSRISIHALREEGDQGPDRPQGRRRDFYPRPPRGGRRW